MKHLIRTFSVLFSALLSLSSLSSIAQRVCPVGYVPKPYQDCANAIRVCTRYYASPDSGLCGPGAILDSVRGSCGTTEQISSWYTFEVGRSGKIAFNILPGDMLDTSRLTNNSGSQQDYDFVMYKLPANSTLNQQNCSLLKWFGLPNPTTSPFQAACNFSGGFGATGLSIYQDTISGGFSQKYSMAVDADSGDKYVLMVTNFQYNPTGYAIRFYTPSDSSIYAQLIPPPSAGITSVSYDPNCTGNCPVTVKLNMAINCNSVSAMLVDPNNITNVVYPIVSCLNGSGLVYGDSLLLMGDFNPTDTNLLLTISGNDPVVPLYYLCTGESAFGETIQLKPSRPGYGRVTSTLFNLPKGQALVSPNPFNNTITLIVPEGDKASITITDVTGREVFNKQALSPATTHTLDLPPGLPVGIYWYRLQIDKRVLHNKIVKE
jgi:hypothetical protein